MAQSFASIPAVDFSDADIFAREFAAVEAQAALEHGPIFKWAIDRGMDAGREFVFMVGPEANRFVLHTHRQHFSHDLGWTPIIGEDFGHGLLNMDDPEHARHRRMWNPAFTSACMEAYLPVIERVIADRSRTWPRRGEIDAYAEAREITFDAAAAALAGFERGAATDRLRELFYVMLHGFDPGKDTFETFMERRDRARAELVQILLRLIAARRAQPADAAPRDVLGMIVHARDESGQALDDTQVLAHLNILLVAGHETTTTLAAWTLYLLATQPEPAAAVAAELRALLPNQGAPISVEAIRAMRATETFIKEAGRLYSPVLNVPRGVVKRFEFGGYEVPAGANVRLALAACHRLPQHFADPARFDPARFSPPREEDKRTPYALVTFGAGPRICIGINFANIEVKTLVAHVLPRYQLEAVPDQQIVHTGFWTAALAGGIRLRVRERTA